MLTGLTCLLIGGELDLSVAGQATICSMLFAHLCLNLPDLPWIIVLLICLGFGACLGLLNTFFVNVLRFPSFIATIGMASVYSGISNVWTHGNNIAIVRQDFLSLGNTAIANRIPVLFVVAVVILAIYGILLARTVFGRNAYLIGNNAAAARLSGVNLNRVRMSLFVNNSMLAALSGIFWTATMKFSSPTAIILALPDFTAITAAILGGIAFFGGHGFIGGAFCGLVLINVFSNTLTILQIPSYWNVFAQGALLVIALVIDNMNEKRAHRTLLADTAKFKMAALEDILSN
jgi:ribose/xylose/arabinose/galactoside ABC-type transport system permease subunit